MSEFREMVNANYAENSDSAASSESDNENRERPRGERPRRTTHRTFVVLDRRYQRPPTRGQSWQRLVSQGRVKIIYFSPSHTAEDLASLLRASFPSLQGLPDLSRIRVQKSGSRGTVMNTVFVGVPNGNRILQEFRNSTRKKVFILTCQRNPPVVSATTTATSTAQLSEQQPSEDEPRNNEHGFASDAALRPIATSSPNPVLVQDDALTGLSDDEDPIITQVLNAEANDIYTNDVVLQQELDNLGPEFHGCGNRAGTVVIDDSERGLLTRPQGFIHSSSLSCIALVQSVIGYSGPVFLPFTFDSLCLQASESQRGMVLVLIQSDSNLLPQEMELLRELTAYCNHEEMDPHAQPFFWVAALNTRNGQDAVKALGGDSLSPQLLVCAPSTACAMPTIIERFQGNLSSDAFLHAINRMQRTMEYLNHERNQLMKQRELKKEQEEALKEALEKERFKDSAVQTECSEQELEMQQAHDATNEVEIRKVRTQRVLLDDISDGTVIRVNTPSGVFTRAVVRGGHFQEIYDWLGSDQFPTLPLFFSLLGPEGQKRQPNDVIEFSEVLRMVPDPGEPEEVIFSGTFPKVGLSDMSTVTCVSDDKRKEQQEDKGRRADGVDEGENSKTKRKERRAKFNKKKKPNI